MTQRHGPTEISILLKRCGEGDSEAEGQLYELVYSDLKVIARALFRNEGPQSSLQPSVIVHEAFLRMPRAGDIDWKGRQHFFATAARAMRRALVDLARARKATKRPRTDGRTELDANLGMLDVDPSLILDVDAALNRLATLDARTAQVVEMRFFAGMTTTEIATVLNVTDRTIKRDWEDGRLWLHAELTGKAKA